MPPQTDAPTDWQSYGSPISLGNGIREGMEGATLTLQRFITRGAGHRPAHVVLETDVHVHPNWRIPGPSVD